MDNTDRIRELLEQIHTAEQRLAGLRAELARLRLELRRLVVEGDRLIHLEPKRGYVYTLSLW